ncbi:OsmC family protein [candidate division WOR-3 bacterium]|nr:OsmC family protein [candidate division WOR-3 bacterium]
MAFEARSGDHEILMDSSENFGGENSGPSPKTLLLAGLTGCSGMDVVSILAKMKVSGYELQIDCSTEVTEEHPKVFREIFLKYVFTGKNLPEDKLTKAVDMSLSKYCGVAAMLSKNSEILREIEIRSS